MEDAYPRTLQVIVTGKMRRMSAALLGQRLGMSQKHSMAQLVERNVELLLRFGDLRPVQKMNFGLGQAFADCHDFENLTRLATKRIGDRVGQCI